MITSAKANKKASYFIITG